MATTRVAAVQAEPVWMDKAGTTQKTIDLIEEAARGDARLVAFPETWIPGYPIHIWSYPVYAQGPYVDRYFENSPALNDPEIMSIRKAARDNNISVVLGFSERDGSSLYMAQILIDAEGEIQLHRRKLKPTHAERTVFGESDGSGLKVVETEVGRLGALNCFEHIQPLSKYAMFSQNEQVHIAGWPCLGINGEVPSLTPDVIMACSRTYALAGSCFVITSSQIMSKEGAMVFPTNEGEPTPVYTGGGGFARVYGPGGDLLSEQMAPEKEGVVFADIDLSLINGCKNIVDPAGHYARPDVTRLVFDNRPQRPVTLPENLGFSSPEFGDSAQEAGPDTAE